ncbi:MAG: LytTR family DNA-binding domain-containing protein [Candidatus Kapaibacterium sp.]
MYERIKAKLKQPYLIKDSVADKLKMSFVYGVFVALFLMAFQPFGLNTLESKLVEICLIYGAITTAAIIILNIIIAPLFPKYFDEQIWNTGREISWTIINILSIGLANAVYTSYLNDNSLSLKYIFLFELYTFMVSILPITFIIVYNESKSSRRYNELSQDINQKLTAHTNLKTTIKIDSQNQNEELEINSSDLLFIKSADNYIEVYHLKEEKVEVSLLRNTLKNVEEIFTNNENIIRCHKSYLVNLQYVKNVSGNAQGYKLHLDFTEISIPVSRKLNDFVKEKLTS